jgi:hypothetical protein
MMAQMHAVSTVSDSAPRCLEELYRMDEADQLACTRPRHVAKIMRDELFAVLRASVITATKTGPEHVNDAMTRGTLEQALASYAVPMIRLASVGDPTTIIRYLVCTFAKWPELEEVLLTTVQSRNVRTVFWHFRQSKRLYLSHYCSFWSHKVGCRRQRKMRQRMDCIGSAVVQLMRTTRHNHWTIKTSGHDRIV